MEGKIRVTTEALKATANEFQAAMGQIRQYTTMMTDQVTGLSGKFEGEAATTYINKFNMLQDDIEKLANMVNEHVTDLNEMADMYGSSETKNIEQAQSLAGDVLK